VRLEGKREKSEFASTLTTTAELSFMIGENSVVCGTAVKACSKLPLKEFLSCFSYDFISLFKENLSVMAILDNMSKIIE